MSFKLSRRIISSLPKYGNYNFRCYVTNVEDNSFDVVISGGGLIGQTLACALSKNPILKERSFLLIEGLPKKTYEKSKAYSNRVSSIVSSSKKLLEGLGIWKNLHRRQDMNSMKVWGYHSDDFVHFTHDDAYIIENDDIINATIVENEELNNLKILYGTCIKEITLSGEPEKKKHKIVLNDASVYETALLLGADGANSFIRQKMDLNYVSWKYNQLGIVATVHLADEKDSTTAWQRFLPEGPIALLPLAPGVSSLVWSTCEKKAKDLLKLPDEIFVDALNGALHSKAVANELVNAVSGCAKELLNLVQTPPKHSGSLEPPHVKTVVAGSRAGFPLGFGHSAEYTRAGVALVGDAAHRVHPLAGQGVNIGFRDIRTLEQCLVEGVHNGRPLGHLTDLKNYETQCQRQNLPVMLAIDLLHRVYTSDLGIVQSLGNIGFHFANSLVPVKSVMRQVATS